MNVAKSKTPSGQPGSSRANIWERLQQQYRPHAHIGHHRGSLDAASARQVHSNASGANVVQSAATKQSNVSKRPSNALACNIQQTPNAAHNSPNLHAATTPSESRGDAGGVAAKGTDTGGVAAKVADTGGVAANRADTDGVAAKGARLVPTQGFLAGYTIPKRARLAHIQGFAGRIRVDVDTGLMRQPGHRLLEIVDCHRVRYGWRELRTKN